VIRSLPIKQEAASMSERRPPPIICRGSIAIFAWLLTSVILQEPIVQAGQISGSQGFSAGNPTAPVLVPGGSDLQTATAIELGTLTTNGSSTGDFATYVSAGQSVGDPTLTLASPTTFTFSATGFGTFTGSSILNDVGFSILGSFFREIELSGTYTPGTDFPLGDRVPNLVEFTVTLTQTFPGGAIGDGGTVFVASVPEPSSIGLLLLGTFGVAIGYYRRLRSR
jgi:PEP-CTERM motif